MANAPAASTELSPRGPDKVRLSKANPHKSGLALFPEDKRGARPGPGKCRQGYVRTYGSYGNTTCPWVHGPHWLASRMYRQR